MLNAKPEHTVLIGHMHFNITLAELINLSNDDTHVVIPTTGYFGIFGVKK